jgi:hypothetical protein
MKDDADFSKGFIFFSGVSDFTSGYTEFYEGACVSSRKLPSKSKLTS